jgi:cytochrome c
MRSALVFAALLSLAAPGAQAQMTLPAAAPLSGADLFKRQCAACHTTSASDPQRQGPTLSGVVGRKAGSVPGFHYSPGFAQADWSWDETRLDAWLTNPQAVIPGAIMPYKQAKPEIRAAIIQYLTDVH